MATQHAHAKHESSHASASTHSKHRMLCRVGYAAHGVVYFLLGAFAIDAAFGGGGDRVQGSTGAISELGSGTFGTVLLTILGLGLLGYSYLRFWMGFANPAGHDDDAKGIAVRIGRVCSGLAQAALAIYALSLAYGWFSTGGSGGASDLTARVMGWPGGRWIIGIVGVGIIGAAIAQAAKCIKASFMPELEVDYDKQKWVKPLGRFGFGARAVVFAIVGVFVTNAAINANPEEAKGLGGALRTLQGEAYGPWLLGAVALGLIAFGVLRMVYARYAVLPDRRPDAG